MRLERQMGVRSCKVLRCILSVVGRQRVLTQRSDMTWYTFLKLTMVAVRISEFKATLTLGMNSIWSQRTKEATHTCSVPREPREHQPPLPPPGQDIDLAQVSSWVTVA
jgi:hypothetical protein